MATVSAKVVSHTRVSDPGAAQEIFLLRLMAPESAAKARPGQFVMLKVAAGIDPLLARPFSVHGVEGGELLILYRLAGKGTRLLSQVKEGQELTLWGPLGRGFDLVPEKVTLAMAGGMGIAPIIFAANFLQAKGATLYLSVGVQTTTGHLTRTQRVEYEIDSKALAHWLSIQELGGEEHGLITAGIGVRKRLSEADAVLACGPIPMLKAVAKLCAEHKVPCQVSLEAPMACGVGACLGCAIPAAGGGYLRACQEGPVMDAAAVDWGRL